MSAYSDILEVMITNRDKDVYTLSTSNKVMLIFLRHFGCMFCRSTLDDLSKVRGSIEATGTIIVFVHMAEDDIAEAYFEHYNLSGVQHISDPDMSLYELFGVAKGVGQLYNLKVWKEIAMNTMKHGLAIRKELGVVRQMPGVIMIKDGEVIKRIVYENIAAKPNYLEIINDDDPDIEVRIK